MNWKDKIGLGSSILLVLFIGYLFFFQPYKIQDEGEYDWCVRWYKDGYMINREDIVWLCFDFENRTAYCEPFVNDFGELILTFNETDQERLQCTRWVKSIDPTTI